MVVSGVALYSLEKLKQQVDQRTIGDRNYSPPLLPFPNDSEVDKPIHTGHNTPRTEDKPQIYTFPNDPQVETETHTGGKPCNPLDDLFQHVFQAKKRKKKDGNNENENDVEQTEHTHGGGKNAQHGKAENQPSQGKQIEDLKKQLQSGDLTRREKKKIQNKIQNIDKAMKRRQKGENHSNNAKGN